MTPAELSLGELLAQGASLFGMSFVGGVFWVVNAETTAAIYAAKLGWNPFVVATICTAGQLSVYGLLFRTGGWLVPKWRWLARQVERTKAKHGHRLEDGYLVTTSFAALLGVPPMSAMAVLASGFTVTLPHFLLVAGTLRWLRFLAVAFAGQSLLDWLGR